MSDSQPSKCSSCDADIHWATTTNGKKQPFGVHAALCDMSERGRTQKEEIMHPAVQNVLHFFESEHLPEHLKEPAQACRVLAVQMADTVPHNAELTVGLRKLLEAKDCFVRAVLAEELR